MDSEQVSNWRTGAVSSLERLETLWLQLAGQTCNLSCPRCYVGSHPENSRLAFMTFDQVRLHCEEAHRLGVRRIAMTGGEPLLHGSFTEIVNMARHYAPTVVLTNAILLTPHHLFRLKHADDGLFPVEFHVSLDGNNAAAHDQVRGPGSFLKAMGGIELLRDYGMIPVIRVVKTWPDLEEGVTLSGYRQLLKELGIPQARLRVQPLYPAFSQDAVVLLTPEPAARRLPCAVSRVVSSAGVHACPMRLDRWLGASLSQSETEIELSSPACNVCRALGSAPGL